MDVETLEGGAIGKWAEGAASPKHSLRRTTPTKTPGRLGGRRGRGHWLGRKELLLKGRIRSEANREGPLVNTDSKLEGAPEREGDTGAGPGPVT